MKANVSRPSAILMAGIKRDQTEAAIMTPEANPKRLFCTFCRIWPIIKNTQAAPAVVPINGIITPKNTRIGILSKSRPGRAVLPDQPDPYLLLLAYECIFKRCLPYPHPLCCRCLAPMEGLASDHSIALYPGPPPGSYGRSSVPFQAYFHTRFTPTAWNTAPCTSLFTNARTAFSHTGKIAACSSRISSA